MLMLFSCIVPHIHTVVTHDIMPRQSFCTSFSLLSPINPHRIFLLLFSCTSLGMLDDKQQFKEVYSKLDHKMEGTRYALLNPTQPQVKFLAE